MSYYFHCQFTDDAEIIQTPEDKSQTTEGRNAFYDVLQRIDDVKFFAIFDEDTGDTWAVDLTTGEFCHDGVIFMAGDSRLDLTNTKLKLVYFIHNRVSPDYHLKRWHFGYQFIGDDGHNHQVVISPKEE